MESGVEWSGCSTGLSAPAALAHPIDSYEVPPVEQVLVQPEPPRETVAVEQGHDAKDRPDAHREEVPPVLQVDAVGVLGVPLGSI